MPVELFHVVFLVQDCRHALGFHGIGSRWFTSDTAGSQVEGKIDHSLLAVQIFLLESYAIKDYTCDD